MLRRLLLLLIGTLLLGACGGEASKPSLSETTSPKFEATSTDSKSLRLRDVTLALSYIPNVQFAPFYVAESKGYYKAAGLKVKFDYNFETDVAQRLAQGNIEFAMMSGISTLLARQQGLPVVTVATINQKFPVVFVSKAKTPLAKPQDLKGKRIGLPGHYGANYYAVLALLHANKMAERELDLQDIGFNQVQMLLEDKVDVAVCYAVNEPIQLANKGEKLNILSVDYPLASDGLAVNQKLLDKDAKLVQSFVQATLHGLQATLDDPDMAFEVSLNNIPEAKQGDSKLQRKVLQAALEFWKSDKLGFSDLTVWEKTQEFLLASKLLNKALPLEGAVNNSFIQ